MTQFFGYWAGSLPPVTELHFRSFLYYHPNSYYDLWLDRDIGSSIPTAFRWLERYPQIQIHHFSLNELIEKFVSPLNLGAEGKFFDIARFIHRKKIIRYLNLKNYYSPLFKLNYKHSSPLFTYKTDLVYRGDLARCILPFAHYRSACLYTDLDVCFLSDLNTICRDRGFVYRWEDYHFANSAILYCPDLSTAEKILEMGNTIECFRPWYLFTDSHCEALNLDIYPTNRFDAMWDPHSLLTGDANKFFLRSTQSQDMVNELFAKNYIANHWHNNWRTTAEEGSAYDLLLNQYRSL